MVLSSALLRMKMRHASLSVDTVVDHRAVGEVLVRITAIAVR